jgi:hypothetical protein
MRLQTEPCRDLCYIEQIIQLYLCLPQLPTQLQTPLNLPLIPYLKILNGLLIELHPEIGHAQLPIRHAILLHFLKMSECLHLSGAPTARHSRSTPKPRGISRGTGNRFRGCRRLRRCSICPIGAGSIGGKSRSFGSSPGSISLRRCG